MFNLHLRILTAQKTRLFRWCVFSTLETGGDNSLDERDVYHLGSALTFPGQIVGGKRYFLNRCEDAAVSGENVAQRAFRRNPFVLDPENLRARAEKNKKQRKKKLTTKRNRCRVWRTYHQIGIVEFHGDGTNGMRNERI